MTKDPTRCIPLARLKPGQCGTVQSARLEQDDAALLRAMGLRLNSTIRLCRAGEPCIISVAITGSVPRKKDNPALPVTVVEQIESTHAAYEAGAALVHVHVRNGDETPSSELRCSSAAVQSFCAAASCAARILSE